MYKINNNIEDKNIFKGTESEFIDFMQKIAIENGDTNFSILGISDANEYLEDFCDNLDLDTSPNYIVGSLTIAQITENSLLDEVDKALKSREAFVDNEVGMSERIYNADVFEAILGDTKVSDKAESQLNDLNDQTVNFNYVMIINA